MQEDEVFIIIMFTLLVGFFFLMFWLVKRTITAAEREWTALARHLSLKLNFPEGKWSWMMGNFPTIEGNYKGYNFYNYMYTRGSGKHKKTYTAFKITGESPINHTFQLYKEGFFSKIGKAFGGQDIEIGHAAFDEGFIIKSDDEDFAKRVLNGQIRQTILHKLQNMPGTFQLEDGVLQYSAMLLLNSEKNRQQWETAVHLGIEMMKEMERV